MAGAERGEQRTAVFVGVAGERPIGSTRVVKVLKQSSVRRHGRAGVQRRQRDETAVAGAFVQACNAAVGRVISEAMASGRRNR